MTKDTTLQMHLQALKADSNRRFERCVGQCFNIGPSLEEYPVTVKAYSSRAARSWHLHLWRSNIHRLIPISSGNTAINSVESAVSTSSTADVGDAQCVGCAHHQYWHCFNSLWRLTDSMTSTVERKSLGVSRWIWSGSEERDHSLGLASLDLSRSRCAIAQGGKLEEGEGDSDTLHGGRLRGFDMCKRRATVVLSCALVVISEMSEDDDESVDMDVFWKAESSMVWIDCLSIPAKRLSEILEQTVLSSSNITCLRPSVDSKLNHTWHRQAGSLATEVHITRKVGLEVRRPRPW